MDENSKVEAALQEMKEGSNPLPTHPYPFSAYLDNGDGMVRMNVCPIGFSGAPIQGSGRWYDQAALCVGLELLTARLAGQGLSMDAGLVNAAMMWLKQLAYR